MEILAVYFDAAASLGLMISGEGSSLAWYSLPIKDAVYQTSCQIYMNCHSFAQYLID
jgi:hypothetical protein